MSDTAIEMRHAPDDAVAALCAAGIHPLLARLFAARGLADPTEAEMDLGQLLPPDQLKNIDQAAQRLIKAITQGERILVVADYDADGATACAVAIRGLRRFGAKADFLVPDRFRFGYGLTTALVEHALKTLAHARPDLIITVDNGISSIEGVRLAKENGIDVLVTDHHLPGPVLPDTLIVNPNLVDCPFPSKHLAGVGVMFYLLLALRRHLRDLDPSGPAHDLRLDDLLPIVALGTVADVVRLDANNRRLVSQGLQRLRRGTSFPGLNALFSVSGIDPARATPSALGFSIGPRLNAAGRLDDMTVGIQCLLEDQPEAALRLAQTLDQLNRERRAIEAGAQEAALAQAEDMIASQSDPAQGMFSLALFRADWHPGIVGLIAGRLKERFYRPAIVFALDPQNPEQLKGSGRSIPGVHLRDILERIDTLHPGLIAAFGGHAMAAGLTIRAADFPRFKTLFEATTSDFADPSDLRQLLTLDGPLEPDFLRLDVADLIEQQIWGQGFPAPIFSNDFIVHRSRRLKEKHLKLELSLAAQAGAASARLDAIWFNAPQDLPPRARLAYRLATNEWQGLRQVQLEIVSAL